MPCAVFLRRGPGVVGQQPILKPGASFEYNSACPLFTTFGTMEGEYEMVTLNAEGEWMDKIEVKIGRFALRKPDLA
jgi:ApaG protein